MANKNKNRKCKLHGESFPAMDGVVVGVSFFCSMSAAFEFADNAARKSAERRTAKEKREKENAIKDFNRQTKAMRKEARTLTEWYNRLQDLVNQFVTKVRDAGKPCYTCGTTNPNIKYDAGHCFTRKARPDIRFELTNIHIQCSVQCNVHASGAQGEHKARIADEYGAEHLAWLTLETNHKPLKEQFPHWTDIEAEMVRYRKILRENGIKPSQ